VRRPVADHGRSAQQQRDGDADGHGIAFRLWLGGPGQGSGGAVQPSAGHAMIGAALQAVLRLEMAADPVGAGDGVHRDQLVRAIHRVQVR